MNLLGLIEKYPERYFGYINLDILVNDVPWLIYKIRNIEIAYICMVVF